MAIHYRVLGSAGRDNAVYVVSDSGQSITRLLLDCGEECASSLSVSDLQCLDSVCFSHFHIDHVAGFDTVIRHNYNRDGKPLVLIGPQEANRVLSHRLRGFTWNLVESATGSIEIREFGDGQLTTSRLETRHRFEASSNDCTSNWDRCVYDDQNVTVEAIELDHDCVSAGYVIRERPRLNIDTGAMSDLGLAPGRWLQRLKSDSVADEVEVEIEGATYRVGDLRQQIVRTKAGESLAYLTDFRISDPDDWRKLANFVRGVDTLICENSYCDADRDLAARNYHLTSSDVGRLAKQAEVNELILFHVSSRYSREEWQQQLHEVRRHFDATHWPTHWPKGW